MKNWPADTYRKGQKHIKMNYADCLCKLFPCQSKQNGTFVVQCYRWIKIFEKGDDGQFWVTLACPQYVGSVMV